MRTDTPSRVWCGYVQVYIKSVSATFYVTVHKSNYRFFGSLIAWKLFYFLSIFKVRIWIFLFEKCWGNYLPQYINVWSIIVLLLFVQNILTIVAADSIWFFQVIFPKIHFYNLIINYSNLIFGIPMSRITNLMDQLQRSSETKHITAILVLTKTNCLVT